MRRPFRIMDASAFMFIVDADNRPLVTMCTRESVNTRIPDEIVKARAQLLVDVLNLSVISEFFENV